MNIATSGAKFICDTLGNCINNFSDQICSIPSVTTQITSNLADSTLSCAAKAISNISYPTCLITEKQEFNYAVCPSFSQPHRRDLPVDERSLNPLIFMVTTVAALYLIVSYCSHRYSIKTA